MSRSPRQTGQYATRRWKRLRLSVLQAADWRCHLCGRYAREVHHLKPTAKGGGMWDEANLAPICRSCHIGEHRHSLTPGRAAWREYVSGL